MGREWRVREWRLSRILLRRREKWKKWCWIKRKLKNYVIKVEYIDG